MRKFSALIALFAAMIMTTSMFAQSSDRMTYQAVIRDADQNLAINTVVGMKISIIQGSISGTMVYSEIHTPTTNANGLVSIEIGGESGFDAIDWANGPYYMKTEADPSGGTTYTITGTTQMLSVPYALHAKTAEMATGELLMHIEELRVHTGLYKVEDVHGNSYPIVIIGSQFWMAENLKTISLNDGTAIPLVTEIAEWPGVTTPAYCWQQNDSTSYSNLYGALYNWHTVNSGKICPSGWHVPSNEDWTTLVDYLGGKDVAGGKLKESGTTHWNPPDIGATNETGFTALPGGSRGFSTGYFASITDNGFWWSATESIATDAWFWYMSTANNTVSSSTVNKKAGFSIRCIRD